MNKIEKSIIKYNLKGWSIIFFIIISIMAVNYITNTVNFTAIAETTEQHETEKGLFEAEIKRLSEIQQMYDTLTYMTEVDTLKIESIEQYFNNVGGAGVLQDKAKVFVEIGKVYQIDPFRAVSISLHESAKGTSVATRKQKNISGMNNSAGEYTDVYNLKVYKSIDESIHHLIYKMKTLYKDQWGLETLSEIGARYAPVNDPRQGLDGMDNTIWFKYTSKHYYAIEGIYQAKLKQKGLK